MEFVKDDDPLPVKLGDHCTGDHLIRRDTADEDDGTPVDTSALVMLDKATGWIAVYPKASVHAPHDRSSAAFCWCQRQDA